MIFLRYLLGILSIYWMVDFTAVRGTTLQCFFTELVLRPAELWELIIRLLRHAVLCFLHPRSNRPLYSILGSEGA